MKPTDEQEFHDLVVGQWHTLRLTVSALGAATAEVGVNEGGVYFRLGTARLAPDGFGQVTLPAFQRGLFNASNTRWLILRDSRGHEIERATAFPRNEWEPWGDGLDGPVDPAP